MHGDSPIGTTARNPTTKTLRNLPAKQVLRTGENSRDCNTGSKDVFVLQAWEVEIDVHAQVEDASKIHGTRARTNFANDLNRLHEQTLQATGIGIEMEDRKRVKYPIRTLSSSEECWLACWGPRA